MRKTTLPTIQFFKGASASARSAQVSIKRMFAGIERASDLTLSTLRLP